MNKDCVIIDRKLNILVIYIPHNKADMHIDFSLCSDFSDFILERSINGLSFGNEKDSMDVFKCEPDDDIVIGHILIDTAAHSHSTMNM